MADIEQYLNPLDLESIGFDDKQERFETWGDRIEKYTEKGKFPVLDTKVNMAIVGVEEDRASLKNQGCAFAPDRIRSCFYPLMPQDGDIKITDLGNIKKGKTVNDTYFAMAAVISELLQNGILPIVLGGSNDVVLGLYKAYVDTAQIINVLNVDSRLDLIGEEAPLSDENFIHKLLCNEPNYLFDYTHIAYQSYFVDKKALELLDSLRFEYKRLGEVQRKLEDIEPMVRDADMLLADVECIRASDAPAASSPHGLYGEEFCKIINYAGMSDKLTSVCFTGLNPIKDIGDRTAQVVAHAIYYLIEGYLWRKADFPYKDKSNYLKFNVQMEDDGGEVVFYKSKKSSRWWVEVPCSQESRYKYMRHYIVPCLYDDYTSAMRGEVPIRWLIAYNKMNL
ncbi:MAG: formimidoylglutamase [Bacteroidales bacterium]|nr:formimidoylglutamase [Bacteroidales bacterium]